MQTIKPDKANPKIENNDYDGDMIAMLRLLKTSITDSAPRIAPTPDPHEVALVKPRLVNCFCPYPNDETRLHFRALGVWVSTPEQLNVGASPATRQDKATNVCVCEQFMQGSVK